MHSPNSRANQDLHQRVSPIIFARMVTSFRRSSHEQEIHYSALKGLSSFQKPVRTRSHTRVENQEAQQATVQVTEFNEMRNEFRNLTHMMSVMISRMESQPSPMPHKIQDLLKMSHQMKSSMPRLKVCISPLSKSISHDPHLLNLTTLNSPK